MSMIYTKCKRSYDENEKMRRLDFIRFKVYSSLSNCIAGDRYPETTKGVHCFHGYGRQILNCSFFTNLLLYFFIDIHLLLSSDVI